MHRKRTPSSLIFKKTKKPNRLLWTIQFKNLFFFLLKVWHIRTSCFLFWSQNLVISGSTSFTHLSGKSSLYKIFQFSSDKEEGKHVMVKASAGTYQDYFKFQAHDPEMLYLWCLNVFCITHTWKASCWSKRCTARNPTSTTTELWEPMARACGENGMELMWRKRLTQNGPQQVCVPFLCPLTLPLRTCG